jgi:PAS domain S-box-containing protein
MPSTKSTRSRATARRSQADLIAALEAHREAMRQQQEDWLQTFAALHEVRDHYERLYDLAPIGLAALTPSGVVREINSTGAKLIGAARSHIVGKPLLSFVQRVTMTEALAHFQRCRAGDSLVTSEVAFCYRGIEGPAVQLTSSRILTAREPAYYTTIADLSMRRRQEDALRTSEKRYREIVETATEGICIVNTHNRVTFVNRRLAMMLRAAPEDLLGREMYDFVPAGDLPLARTRFLEQQLRREIKEVRLKGADGSIIWTSVSTTPLSDDSDRFSGLLQMYTDITERKEHDAERDRLVAQLVTSQEAERRRIARELHDQIGQHIVGLLLRLEHLSQASAKQPVSPAMIQPLRDLIEVMARDVHHVALELRPTALDDLGLPEALAHYAQDASRRSGIEIDVHADRSARLNATGETVVYRIAQEALTNVLKHAGAQHVSVLLARRGSGVQLTIEDDGIGFDPERLLRFGPLEHRLGLAGMIERAALIGGEVHFDSAPGRGTTVILRVSANEREVRDHEEATPVAS